MKKVLSGALKQFRNPVLWVPGMVAEMVMALMMGAFFLQSARLMYMDYGGLEDLADTLGGNVLAALVVVVLAPAVMSGMSAVSGRAAIGGTPTWKVTFVATTWEGKNRRGRTTGPAHC